MKKQKSLLRRVKRWLDYDPPGALTSNGWRLFNKEFKEVAPIRYWWKNDFRRGFLLPIKWKYQEISYWVKYRTIEKYHIVRSGLKPGYYEIDQLMLNVNFNMLKDFVEVEVAWNRLCWSAEKYEKKTWCERHMPFYRMVFPFRRPDIGIEHLEWEATLDSPSIPTQERSDQQAITAREVLTLYRWWVDERPNREKSKHKSHDRSAYRSLDSEDFDINAKDCKEYLSTANGQITQDEHWKLEDTEMLVRLMRIRGNLWT